MSGGNLGEYNPGQKLAEGVRVKTGGSFTMSGGTVSANYTGVILESGAAFTLSGSSEISGGKGVRVGSGCIVNLSGSPSISGSRDQGISVDAGAAFNLSGSPSISGIEMFGDVSLQSGAKITVTGKMNNTTPIRIKMESPGVFTDSTDTALNETKYFSCVDASCAVGKNSDGQLFLAGYSSVTLDRQSGSGGTAAVTAVNGSVMPEITLPSRTGYTFGGYFTGTNGTGDQYYNADGTSAKDWDKTGNTTLYAKWTANTYTVKFAPGDGSGTMAEQAFTYDVKQALSPNVFTRKGYFFDCWTDSTGWIKFRDNDEVQNLTAEANGTVTLTPEWIGNPYSVAFAPNGGIGFMDNQPFTYGVEKALSANAITRKGHSFSGWKDASGNTYADGQTVKNLTAEYGGTVWLDAQWMVNSYTVKFLPGEGSGTMADQIFTYGEEKALSDNAFTREGHSFSGWEGSDGKTYSDKQEVQDLTFEANGTVTLTAQWTAHTYTVKFDPGEGSGTMADQAFTYDAEQALTANSFTWAGHSFSGWMDEAGKAYSDGQTVKNLTNADKGSVTLKAQWDAVIYKVTVTTDGNGTASADPDSGIAGTEVKLSASPYEGYAFKEWKVVSGGVTVENGKFTIGTEDAEVLAVFEKVYSVSVTTDGNGTASADPSSGPAGKEVTLSASPNEGYMFSEWQVLSGGVSVENGKFTIGTEGVEIKAVFKEKPADVYTVIVTTDGNGSASADPDSGIAGTEVTLTASPNEGYVFSEWQVVSGGVTVENDKFTIGTKDVEIKAVFAAEEAFSVPVDFVFVRYDGSRGVPFDIREGTLTPAITLIKGDEEVSKSGTVKVEIKAKATGASETVTFSKKLADLGPGKYEVVVSGLPKTMEKEVPNAADAPKYKLTAKAEINKKGGITVYLIWDDGNRPEEPVVYPLPEDEIGAYKLLPDGSKEYLLFHTYAICMDWLGNDELCMDNHHCYNK